MASKQIPVHKLPFEELVQRYRGFLVKGSRWKIPGLSEEDIMQELLLLLRHCQQLFDSSRGVSFYAYFRTAAQHKLGGLNNRGRARRKLMAEGFAADVMQWNLPGETLKLPSGLITDIDFAAELERKRRDQDFVKRFNLLSSTARVYAKAKLRRERCSLSKIERTAAKAEIIEAFYDRIAPWRDSLWLFYDHRGRVTTDMRRARTMRKRYV